MHQGVHCGVHLRRASPEDSLNALQKRKKKSSHFRTHSDENETKHKTRYSEFSHQKRRGFAEKHGERINARDPMDGIVVGLGGEEFHDTCAC
jgi:thymidylate kinase